MIITGSWDSNIKLWDPRGPREAGTFQQPNKVGAEGELMLELLEIYHICTYLKCQNTNSTIIIFLLRLNLLSFTYIHIVLPYQQLCL